MIVSPHVTLTYTNDIGQSVTLNIFTPFVCERCEESTPNRIHTTAQAGVHGEFFASEAHEPRHIQLTGFVRREVDTTAAVRILQNTFNSTLPGILQYEHATAHVQKSISCRLEEVPRVYWNRGALRFDIRLIALDPFWRGRDVTEVIAKTIRKFRFPLAIPHGGMAFALRHHNLESVFENAGNVKSGFVATLRARHGTVINPEIRNEVTGERIRLLYAMAANDEIIITNHMLLKRLTINGINGFNRIDAANTRFFLLEVGTNRVGFRADEHVGNLQVHITYTPAFTFVEG